MKVLYQDEWTGIHKAMTFLPLLYFSSCKVWVLAY